MKGKLIRLGIMLGVTVLFYFLGGIFGVNSLFFLAPALLALLHAIIWDLGKCDLLDKGFFKFLKFLIMLGAFVGLLLAVFGAVMPLINEELFDIKNTLTDLQICVTCGAVAMISLTYCLCFGVAENFGNRTIGLFIPVIGVVVGALYGFIGYIGGAISVGFSKVLVCLPVAFALILTISHIKEYGLIYKDLPMDAEFAGFGGKRGTFQKTGRPIEDAMRSVAWSESKRVDLSYNNAMNIEVEVTVYSYSIDFEISGRVYINNPEMTYRQTQDVSEEANKRIADLKTKITNKAQKALQAVFKKNPDFHQDYTLSVKVTGVDCV